jgi:hypothetical protein
VCENKMSCYGLSIGFALYYTPTFGPYSVSEQLLKHLR